MEQRNILRIQEVCKRTGLKPSTIYKLVREKTFPPSVSLTSRSTGWPSDVVDGWVTSRIEGAAK
jgi:prophage regulatory protein